MVNNSTIADSPSSSSPYAEIHFSLVPTYRKKMLSMENEYIEIKIAMFSDFASTEMEKDKTFSCFFDNTSIFLPFASSQ